MNIPSRRDRKPPRAKWVLLQILSKILLLLAIGLLAFVAHQTGNYMGLAATLIFVSFWLLGVNAWGIRRFMPGLNTAHRGIKIAAVLGYACLGLMAITLAGNLPKTGGAPFVDTPPVLPYFTQQEALENEVETPSVVSQAEKPKTQPAAKQESHTETTDRKSQEQQVAKVETSSPVMKSETDKVGSVVTEVRDAHTIEINGQQLIRLIGVSVPDALHPQAVKYLQDIIEHKEVTLLVCPDRPLDNYGRTRAVISIKGENVNRLLIEQGYSRLVITKPSSLDIESWVVSEKIAKEHNRGLWKKHPE
jgi:endonuclease YncB( thermonuclease family)